MHEPTTSNAPIPSARSIWLPPARSSSAMSASASPRSPSGTLASSNRCMRRSSRDEASTARSDGGGSPLVVGGCPLAVRGRHPSDAATVSTLVRARLFSMTSDMLARTKPEEVRGDAPSAGFSLTVSGSFWMDPSGLPSGLCPLYDLGIYRNDNDNDFSTTRAMRTALAAARRLTASRAPTHQARLGPM